MLKQTCIEETPFFDGIACHFLLNDTRRAGSEKNDKLWRNAGGRRVKKIHFASGVLIQWLHAFLESTKKMNLSWT